MRFLKDLENIITNRSNHATVERYLQAVQTYNELAGEEHKHKIVYQIVANYLYSRGIEYKSIRVVELNNKDNKKCWVFEAVIEDTESQDKTIKSTVDFNTLLISRDFESELIKNNCIDFEDEE